jgi:hypothetical protein
VSGVDKDLKGEFAVDEAWILGKCLQVFNRRDCACLGVQGSGDVDAKLDGCLRSRECLKVKGGDDAEAVRCPFQGL